MDETGYIGIIQKVFSDGDHGPYAKATCEILGTVTFSLKSPIWEEKRFPDEGTYVILSGLTKKRAGWRADSGRFLRPSDDQPAVLNQKRDKGEKR